ncbi:hypothetical protein V6N13_048411 [Hibiscus sabdariffa]
MLVVDEFPALQRSGSPFAEEKQRVAKKGRNVVNPSGENETEMPCASIGTDICMGAVGGDGSHQGMQGLVAKVPNDPPASFVSGVAVGGDAFVATAKASFWDMLMGDNSPVIPARQLSDLVVEVLEADESSNATTVPEAAGGSRKPEDLYGPWMQVVNRRRRPVASKNEKSGLQPDQLTSRKSGSRFESLSEALPESDVSDPVLPETIVSEPFMSSEGGSMEEVSSLLMVQGDSQQSVGVHVALVSKAVVPEAHSLPAEVQQVQAATGVQWNENLAFDQVARDDMQD